MASTYVNDLRLEEQATGENSGAWGTKLNSSLEQIAEAFSYGSEAIADASTHTITMADGTSDEARSFYLKCTGGGQACTVTLAPNTVSKVWMIENATSYTLTFTQGSGANVAVAAGEVKMIATDGAGSGAVVYDLLTDTNLAGTTKVAALTASGAVTANAGVSVDNITIDGTEIDLSSGDLTIDVAGDITLDADGGDLKFADGGTDIGQFINSSNDFKIRSVVQDKDLVFEGNDGGSIVTPLTLDMSVGGQVQITNATNHPMTVQSTATNGGYIQYSLGHQGALIGYMGSANQLLSAGGNTDYCIRYQNNLLIGYGAAEKMRLTSGGNVGVGTTNPTTRLHVANATNEPVFVADHQNNSGFGQTIINSACSQNGGSFFFYKAQISGVANKFIVAQDGNVTNTNNSYGSISDQRLKTDIADASSQWNDIKAVKVRKFKLGMQPDDGFKIGVVSQELEASGMNGLVQEKDADEYQIAYNSDLKDQKVKEVKYSVLYMKAIKALQEAMTRIETLETKVKTLEDA